jgi:hypothetical protein
MGMPSGDSPSKAHDYYLYLQAHQQTMQEPATWHVRWLDLAWIWGFVIVLTLVVMGWVWQYRTTRQKTGLYPVDSFGETTELAGPSSLFFVVASAIIVSFAVVLIVGHLIWGQKF